MTDLLMTGTFFPPPTVHVICDALTIPHTPSERCENPILLTKAAS